MLIGYMRVSSNDERSGTQAHIFMFAEGNSFRTTNRRENMTGIFNINRVGTKERYQGTGRLAGEVLIISANAHPYGRHELYCDLSNPNNSKCYYYETSNQPEPVKANIAITAREDGFIELVWTENSTRWEIEGLLSPVTL